VKKIICIIPARKGSKRIPNKNKKLFFGKPIISHVISKIKKFNFFDKIIVSTNCYKIANIAKKNKAEVILRDEKLSDDHTGTREVILDTIKKLENNKLKFDYVCCIYPTSIFIKRKHIFLGLKKLKKNKLDYVFSAKKYEHPIFRSFYKSKKKIFPLFINKKYINKKTQDFNEYYHDAAQFYLGHKNSWKQIKNILYGNVDFIELKKLESIDIDTMYDWNNAKIIWKISTKKS